MMMMIQMMYFHLQCVKWFCAASTVSLVAPVANYAHPPFRFFCYCFYHSFYIHPPSGKLNQTSFFVTGWGFIISIISIKPAFGLMLKPGLRSCPAEHCRAAEGSKSDAMMTMMKIMKRTIKIFDVDNVADYGYNLCVILVVLSRQHCCLSILVILVEFDKYNLRRAGLSTLEIGERF